MSIKSWVEKITGLDKVKEEAIKETREAVMLAREAEGAALEAERLREEAEENKRKAYEEEELAKSSPKDRATRKKEPWVSVLDTHVNKEDIRNGFFELDWNEYFIMDLRKAGYGEEGDPEEEIVDRWFRDIVYNMFAEAGVHADSRGAGYINVVPLDKKRSEVS